MEDFELTENQAAESNLWIYSSSSITPAAINGSRIS
jgi:hypothetical protein